MNPQSVAQIKSEFRTRSGHKVDTQCPGPPLNSHSRQHRLSSREERRCQGQSGSFHNFMRSGVYFCIFIISHVICHVHSVFQSINYAFPLILNGASKQFIEVKVRSKMICQLHAVRQNEVLTGCIDFVGAMATYFQ